MNSPLKWKAFSLIAALVLGIYILLPTGLQVQAKKVASEAAGQTTPFYYKVLPEKELTLGLDLQGGIYVELEVALEEAVRRKTDILSGEISREMKSDGAAEPTFVQSTTGRLDTTFASPNDFKTFQGIFNRYYRRVFVMRGIENPDIAPLVHLVLTEEYRDNLVKDVVAQATESVRNRINRYGVGEPDIRQQGANRIAIELPGLQDPERALSVIKRTGQLEFRMVHAKDAQTFAQEQADLQVKVTQARQDLGIAEDDWTIAATEQINDHLQGQLPAGTEIFFELVRDPDTGKTIRGIPYLLEDKAQVTGDMLETARVTTGQRNQPVVAFSLNKAGGKIFADLTKNNVGRNFAILLDGTVMSAPVIKEAILHAQGQIELGFGNYDTLQREAHDLSLILQEGALPASLSEATKTVVGPTLGADLIRQGFRATWLAALGVILFMLLYYRLAGVVADVALFLNVVLILAILTLFGATLTLPGIAGIVLTIGMAVDANVIINERIKEELRAGKIGRKAVEEGFANAKRAILDANITTLIAGLVLYQFGTGAIKGFAVTLCIGIITTLFTAVVGTRVGFDLLYRRAQTQRARG